MLSTFLTVLHVSVCLFLVLVVLLQQGKGGGMGAALGGTSTQVFGGRGAGNLLTRTTGVCAALFMLTSVSLAYLSSSGDRALRAKVQQEARKKSSDQGALRTDDQGATGRAPPGDVKRPEAPAPEARRQDDARGRGRRRPLAPAPAPPRRPRRRARRLRRRALTRGAAQSPP